MAVCGGGGRRADLWMLAVMVTGLLWQRCRGLRVEVSVATRMRMSDVGDAAWLR